MIFRMMYPLAFVAMGMAGFSGFDVSEARADHRFTPAPRRTIDFLNQSAFQLVQDIAATQPGNRHALRDSRQLYQSVQHLQKMMAGRNLTMNHARRDVTEIQNHLQHLQTTLGRSGMHPRVSRQLMEIQRQTFALERELAYGRPPSGRPGRYPSAAPVGQLGWQTPGSHGMIQFSIRN